jgi:hypothetical protein
LRGPWARSPGQGAGVTGYRPEPGLARVRGQPGCASLRIVRILVFNRARLQAPAAQAINVVHTCAALARAGVEVVVHADLGRKTPDEILRAYGCPPAPGLSFQHMGWRWHSWALRAVAGRLLRRQRTEPTVVFLREVRPYVATLADAARRRGHCIAFEAHNAAGRMAIEAASRIGSSQGSQGPAAAAGAVFRSVAVAGGGGTAPAIWEALPQAAAPPLNGNGRNGFSPGTDAESAARERAALERQILSEVDVLVAPQRLTLEAVRELVREGVPAAVVPNGTRLPARTAPVEQDIDILYLGSLTAWKGVDTLVAAMPLLHPYKLAIVGGREERARNALLAMAVRLGCADRVEFIPPVPPGYVWKLYARARVGVVPLSSSYLEAREYTCPLKLLEMMAAGLPIVTSRLPSVQEYVREGEDALMARSDDPDDFARTIRRLLEDHQLAARLAASATAKALTLSYEQRARRLLALFRDAVCSNS